MNCVSREKSGFPNKDHWQSFLWHTSTKTSEVNFPNCPSRPDKLRSSPQFIKDNSWATRVNAFPLPIWDTGTQWQELCGNNPLTMTQGAPSARRQGEAQGSPTTSWYPICCWKALPLCFPSVIPNESKIFVCVTCMSKLNLSSLDWLSREGRIFRTGFEYT